MSPRLDHAVHALARPLADDLHDLRILALAFRLAVGAAHPIAVALAIDEDGVEHWPGLRSATEGVEEAYLALLSDLLQRGLHTSAPFIVDCGGFPRLARRLHATLGPIVHAASAPQ